MKRRTKLGCGLGAGALALGLLGLGVREILVRLDPRPSQARLSAPTGPPGVPWDQRAAEKLARAETQLRNARTLQARVYQSGIRHYRGRKHRYLEMTDLRLARPNLYRVCLLTLRDDSLSPMDQRSRKESACDGWFAWNVWSPRPDEPTTFFVYLTDGSAPNPSDAYPLIGFWPRRRSSIFHFHSPLTALLFRARRGDVTGLKLEADGAVTWTETTKSFPNLPARRGRMRILFDAAGIYREVEQRWETDNGEDIFLHRVENLVLDAPMSRESFSYSPPENAVPDPNYTSTKWALPFVGLPNKARSWGLPF